MKPALLVILLGFSFFWPLRAEDWVASNGKVYRDVKVLSHNAAYVTILDKDGGGRIPLSTLKPDLQKRFGYDPAQAPAIVAATEAADRRDKAAVAKEKKTAQVQDEERLKEISAALSAAYFAPVPYVAASEPSATATNSVAPNDTAIESEPPTEINDWDYGDAYDYGGIGYYSYPYGYGYGHHRSHTHYGTRGFNYRFSGAVTGRPTIQVYPRH